MGVLQQSRKDQGVIVTTFVTIAMSADFALLSGALWQLIDPSAGLSTIIGVTSLRLCMSGVIAAAIAFLILMVRLGGADNRNHTHRLWYLRFRARILSGNVGHFYARGVRRALARLDRFMGDAGKQDDGLFPHAFGLLRRRAPLWTMQAYDRCLLLALLYPLLVILGIWLCFGTPGAGHLGSAEQALSLNEAPIGARLIATVPGLIWVGAAALRTQFRGWRSLVIIMAGGAIGIAVAFFGTRAVNGSQLSSGALATAFAFAFALAGAQGGSIAVVYAIAAGYIAALIPAILLYNPPNIIFTLTMIGSLLFIIIIIIVVVISIKYAQFYFNVWNLRLFHLLFFVIMMLLCTSGSELFARHADSGGLALLYFLGLLTLVNAPFDWVALGLTRAFLRAGLERRGLWPLGLALADAIVSLAIMALLALAILWATENFNASAIAGGAKEVVVDPLQYLNALANPAERSEPEYWWLYAMLFSTQIPSLLNLIFGMFCALRGLPSVNRWMAANLPEKGGIDLWPRMGVAALWSTQLGIAVTLGCLGLWWLFASLLWAVDGMFGASLLELLRHASISHLL